ncbi:MAG: hypothetical protein ACJAVV_003105 [Alphaproteobacteria bacterium]
MQRQIVYLLLVFAILCAGIYYIIAEDSKSKAISADMEPATLMQQAKVSIGATSTNRDSIQSIQLLRADSKLLNAKLENERWLGFIEGSEIGFPLQTSRLTTLVRDLINADIVERKSAKSKNHARLGLLALSAQNSTSTLLRVATDVTSFELLLGNPAKLQNTQFVRFSDSNQMLLIDKLIALPDDNFAWLEKSLFNISAKAIASIDRTQGEETLWSVNNTTYNDTQSSVNRSIESGIQSSLKAANAKTLEGELFSLSTIEQDEKLAYPLVIDNFISSLLGLTFDSLLTLDTLDRGAYEPLTRLTLTTVDNETILIDIFTSSQPQGEIDSAELVSANHAIKVTTLKDSDYLNQWLFVVPTYQIDSILKDRLDFLVKKSNN